MLDDLALLTWFITSPLSMLQFGPGHTLSCLDIVKGNYLRVLFVDYSSAVTTTFPSRLGKYSSLSMNPLATNSLDR